MTKVKTNVLRILDKEKVPYSVTTYAVEDGKIDGVEVAKKVGKNPDEVFKTLVLEGKSSGHYVCVIPVDKELDLKAVGKWLGEKKIELLPLKDLLKTTGYIRGGCSPIGMKKPLKTLVDESAKDLKTITVSAGKVGVQVSVAPEMLMRLTGASYAKIICSN